MAASPSVILSIAGSDCSCGAGIQADLKSITAMGGYAVTAVTSVVSEVPGRVSRIHLMDGGFIADEIEVLFRSFPISAAKSGMLGGTDQVMAVARAWRAATAGRAVPLVIDPVMVATGGGRLITAEAEEALRDEWLPQATLITPNMDEAAVFWGRRPICREDLAVCAAELVRRFGCAVLVKGGHLHDAPESPDVLCDADDNVTWFEAPRTPGVQTHGTGCSYSAAIAAGLGLGLPLQEAVRIAKTFVSRAISGHFAWQMPDSGAVHALNHQPPA